MSLDHNFFYGTFPNLSSSSKLQILDVRCNFFSGTNAPTSSQTIIINTTGNCFNDSDLNSKIKCSQAYFDCPSFQASIANGGCPSCPSVCPSLQTVTDATTCVCRSPITTGATSTLIRKVVGSIVGVGGFLILARFLCWKWKRTHKQPLRDHEVQGVSTLWEAPEGVLRFTLHVLANATHNFESSQEIGQGGFGKVFYGILDDGKKVAVKRASSSCIQSSSVFHNEVILLSRLHHRNLVHLVGFCDDDDVQILVYEYMTNGNLHTLLFKNNSRLTLNWFRRLDIALDVAQGLEYLHSFADPPVIHRDVKPSNILLDENMVAKLSDFGISKVAREFETHFSTRPAGTVGYIDPQYFLREQLTTASDVYSFGVVLLELISGQKSIDNTRLDDHNLVAWVKSKLNTHGLKSIVDPRLGDEYPEQIYQDIVRLAIDCASFNSKDRPSMKEVVNILDACHSAVSPHLLQEVHDTDNWSYKEQSKDTEGGNAGSSTSFSVSFPSFR